MGTNNFTQIGTGTPVNAVGDLVDQYFTALSINLVPRNSLGVVATLAGGLGSATYKWNACYVDNLLLDGNTLSATNAGGDLNLTTVANGNLELTPGGTGETNVNSNLNVGGELTLANQPVFGIKSDTGQSFNNAGIYINFSNSNVITENGGDWFDSVVSTTKITPPSAGYYELLFLPVINDFYARTIYIQLERYNSSDVLQETAIIVSSYFVDVSSVIPAAPDNYVKNETTKVFFETGDYYKILVAHHAVGGTGITGISSVRMAKLF